MHFHIVLRRPIKRLMVEGVKTRPAPPTQSKGQGRRAVE